MPIGAVNNEVVNAVQDKPLLDASLNAEKKEDQKRNRRIS